MAFYSIDDIEYDHEGVNGIFDATNRYRFGADGNGWVGERYQRRYEPFTASSPSDAWNEGRRRWFSRGPKSSACLLGLEREYIVPPTILLNGIGIDRSDRVSQKTTWLRVAVGYPDRGWRGEPDGGISIEVTGRLPVKVLVRLWGQTEQDLFDSHFMHNVNDKSLLRACIRAGLDDPANFYRNESLPVWVHYTENKSAADAHPGFHVCATPALWRSVLGRLENHDDGGDS